MFKLFFRGEPYLYYVKSSCFCSLYCAKYRYKCYYSALGLNSNATEKEIKAAYYKLSQQFHPDKNYGCEESTNKFKQIAEAYEILGNVKQKKKYDETLQSQYSNNSNFPHGTRNQRPFFYQDPPSPPTGRSKIYNYEEHFKQHYERMHRVQEEHYKIMHDAHLRWQKEKFDRYSRHRTDEIKPDYSFGENHDNKIIVTMILLLILVFPLITSVPFNVEEPRNSPKTNSSCRG